MGVRARAAPVELDGLDPDPDPDEEAED